MSTQSAIEKVEALNKCQQACKDNHGLGGTTAEGLGYLTSSGREAKMRRSKCLAECAIKYGGSAELLEIDALAEELHTENMEAQAAAQQQIAGCAEDYFAKYQELAIAHLEFRMALEKEVGLSAADVKNMLSDVRGSAGDSAYAWGGGTSLGTRDYTGTTTSGVYPDRRDKRTGHSYNPPNEEQLSEQSEQYRALNHAIDVSSVGDDSITNRAAYYTYMKAYDNPNDDLKQATTHINYDEASEPLKTMTELRVLGNLNTTKPNNSSGCTGVYWNFESIVSTTPAGFKGLQIHDGFFNQSAETYARYRAQEYPYMFAGCIGALSRQVEALLDNFENIGQSNIQALKYGSEAADGEQSPYAQVTEAITGTGASTYGDDNPKTINNNRGGNSLPRGASVGILTHGAPLYWPTNFTERDSAALTSDSENTLNLPNASDHFSLAAWAGRVSDMNQQWARWAQKFAEADARAGITTSKELYGKMDRFSKILDNYCAKVLAIAPDMQAAAQCIFEADRAADDVINANDQKLLDEMPGNLDHIFDGFVDPFGWIGARDPDGLAKRIEDARRRNRALADTGGAALDALPEKLFFKEQCFLLSYIGIFADWKKYYLDRANVRQNANDAIISGVASKGHKKLPYHKVDNLALKPGPTLVNASLLVDGDPYGFMNKLTACPYTYRLNNIENWELSNIQPRIRLFKVIYDSNGNEKEIELAFDSHFSGMDKMFMEDKASRGAGVGLKTFNFTYDGSNPFAAKKSIKAKLVIFANTFQELLRERQGKSFDRIENDTAVFVREPYKYIELALKTGAPYKAKECKPNQDYLDMVHENEEMAKLNFRLKAVVGLSAPTGLNGFKTSDAEVIQKALNDSYVTLNLTPTTHDFDLDEQGRVTFTINYLAYADDFFDQNGYNVFADPNGSYSYRRIVRELQMKTYQRDCSGGDSVAATEPPEMEGEGDNTPPSASEHLAAIKEKFAQEVQREQLESVSNLVDSMACANVIYYVNVPYSEVRQFLHEGPFANYNKYMTSYKAKNFIEDNASQSSHITTAVQDAMSKIEQAKKSAGEGNIDRREKNQIAASLATINPSENNVAFFYVSDLVDIVLANIQQELEELPKALAEGITTGEIKDTTKCDINQKIRELQLYAKNFKRMRILLGPVEVLHQKPADSMMSVFVNFGDLPVSLKYFLEWLTSAVLKRDETHYPLAKFLNDFFNTLIRNFLNNDACFAYNIAQNVRVNQAVVTSYATEEGDDITAAIKKKLPAGQARINLSDFKMPQTCPGSSNTDTGYISVRDCDLPILNVAGVPDGSALTYAPLGAEINYFVYFAGRTMPTEKQRGIRCNDEDAGIQHYLLGRNKGLVKNIKLSKTDSPGLAEVRFEQDGFDGLRQLRNVYDVQVDTFASVQSFPGNYIYISPQGFDPSVAVDNDGFDLTDMGIGGYCMIVRSEHEFGEGFANSTIHAKWVASVDSAANQENESQTENSNQNAAKCGIYAYRHGATK